MKRLFIFIFTFVLIFFHVTCAAALPVLAADVDYSHLEPDENGKYWIYYKVSGELQMVNGSTHTVDLDFYVDVTHQYESTGHPLIYFCPNVVYSYNLNAYGTNTPEVSFSNNVQRLNCVIIEGVFDDLEVDYSATGVNINDLVNFVDWILGGNNGLIHSNSLDCFQYIPTFKYYVSSDKVSILDYEYIQEKPKIYIIPPQEPVFEYAYSSSFHTSTASGVDVILRYPYLTASEYYSDINKLDYIPLMGLEGTKVYRTILFVKLTVDVGGTVNTTYWAPVGSIGYSEDNSNTWSEELLYYFFNDLEEAVYDANVWFESWAFGNSWSGIDGMSYLHFDLSQLPKYLSNCGIEVGNNSLTLLGMEVAAQNYHTELEQYSDIVYSSYDFNKQEVGSGIVTQPGGTINGVTNVTVNNVITTGNTATLPTVNNSNTVNQGDTNVTVNNNVPSDINVNVNVKPNGDKGTGIFGWLADKVDDATQTVKDIDEGFDELIAAINEFVGDFPGLFSWIMGSLPAPYVIWLELGIAVGVVIVILKVCKIW